MRAMHLGLLLSLAGWLSAATYAQQAPTPAAESAAASALEEPPSPDVRVARISALRSTGDDDVMIDRADDLGYQKALLNLPVAANDMLMTRSGFAELEFEEGSSMRMTPYAIASIKQMSRRSDNRFYTLLQLSRGVVYLSLGQNSGDFAVALGNERLHIAPNSHVRLTLIDGSLQVSTFKGHSTFEWGVGAIGIPSGDTLAITTFNGGGVHTIRGLPLGVYDAWDVEMETYRMAQKSAALRSLQIRYGASDLDHYGQFVDYGCGQMWRPYFTGANWQPYDNGYWVWRRGFGYTWVSPYQWGWLPYHSGYWESCNGLYGWRPDARWRGQGYVNPAPPQPPAGKFSGVVDGHRYPKPTPPRHDGGPVQKISTRPQQPSGIQGPRFIFQADSAGYGVPRGVFSGKQLAHYDSEMRKNNKAEVSAEMVLTHWQVSTAPDGAERAIPADPTMAGLDVIVLGGKLHAIHNDAGPRNSLRLRDNPDLAQSLNVRPSALPRSNIHYFNPAHDRVQHTPPQGPNDANKGVSTFNNGVPNTTYSGSTTTSSSGATLTPNNSSSNTSSSNMRGDTASSSRVK